MAFVRKMAKLPYTAKQMYQLVDNIDEYAEFLPLCQSSRVISRHDNIVRASLCIAKGGFSRSFTTENYMTPYSLIDIRLVDGPFKKLEGFWHFQDKPQGQCIIRLELEYEFSTPLVGTFFAPLFHQVAHSLVGSFKIRSNEVYG